MNYKSALITGASTGIGKATAERLAKENINLILLARREEKLKQLQASLCALTKVHIIACDITNLEQVKQALDDLPEDFREIDIVVNNAGLALGLGTAQESDWIDWQQMISTNCMALTFLTRLLLDGFVERNKGHIINIGSIAGTYPYRGGNVYGATKAFVEQFSINLKADLLGTNVRVTNIEPGMVGESEFSLVRFKGDESKAAAVYDGINALRPQDIAESICWALSQPAHVNINRIEIMPVAQAPSRTAYHKDQL